MGYSKIFICPPVKKNVSLQNILHVHSRKKMLYKLKVLPLLFFVAFFFVAAVQSRAQNINTTDLSQVNVDDLTDEQIQSLLMQAQSAGLSESQLIQMASARGMSATEIEKLQTRIQQLQTTGNQTTDTDLFGQPTSPQNSLRIVNGDLDSVINQDPRSPEQIKEDSLRARIYGADLFLNAVPRFEPNLQIATPLDYVVGTGDELQIDIYGHSEANYTLKVSPDGNINIPYVGVVNVGGTTIQQATKRIQDKLASIYTAIKSGATKVNVSLGNIRTIKVVITGEVVKPGTYTLPSVASVFNALYSSGGPTSKGSLRSIKVIRGGEIVADVDLYEFLQNGIMQGNVSLRDQDIIQVQPYISRVELIGAVKRPLLFEIKPGETVADLLQYAGGFTEDAYTARLSVVRTTGRDYRIEDVLESQFNQFEPKSGDKFTIEKALNRFSNRVILQGAVFRPGQYELSQGLTLSMLIKKAEGLKEDAFLKRGYIVRLKDDFQREQLSFNPAEIVAGTQADIPLKREDLVIIPSLFDLREEYTVNITGEVRNPGQFPFSEGMTVEELILQAGGFTEAGSAQRVEIARRLRNADEVALSASAHTAEVFTVNIGKDFDSKEAQFELKPYDLVSVRPEPGYERQRTVRIEGEVLYPGEYALSRKDERVSDIIKRAGGFTAYAYIEGASLKRTPPKEEEVSDSTSKADKQELITQEELEQERVARLQSLQMATINPDVNASNIQQSIKNNYVGIDLPAIMKQPGQNNDLLLEEGDVIRVPKQLQTVKISGEVLSPVTALYANKRNFKDYISQAGGFSEKALKRRSFVVYANGSARSTKKILFFNNYPKVKPGSEIFVPQRLPRERLGATQLIGIGTGLASLAAIVVSLLRN